MGLAACGGTSTLDLSPDGVTPAGDNGNPAMGTSGTVGGMGGTAGPSGSGGGAKGGSAGSTGSGGSGGSAGNTRPGVGGATGGASGVGGMVSGAGGVTGAGAQPAGMGGASGGSAGSGGMAVAGGCAFPSCIGDLTKDCPPTGACVVQRVGMENRTCYASGVKNVTSIAIGGMSASLTVTYYKPGGAICYTATAPIATGGATPTVVLTYNNAAGRTVGTATTTGNIMTVTCAGQAPVNVDLNACGAMAPQDPAAMMAAACTMGTCN